MRRVKISKKNTVMNGKTTSYVQKWQQKVNYCWIINLNKYITNVQKNMWSCGLLLACFLNVRRVASAVKSYMLNVIYPANKQASAEIISFCKKQFFSEPTKILLVFWYDTMLYFNLVTYFTCLLAHNFF